MAGLWTFSFKPGNWLGGTRLLTPEQRGVYIDILSMIYEHGGPIAYVADDLCRILGFRYRAKLDKVLGELVTREKIWMRDGFIGNKVADEYLARIQSGAAPANDSPPRGGRETVSSTVRKAGDAKPATGSDGAIPGPSPSGPATVAQTSPERRSSVAGARGEESQSFQRVNPPNLNPNPVRENLADRSSLVPGEAVPDAVCRQLIDAFDDARAAEWGEAQRRAFPAGPDWRTAREWAAQGADAALVAEVARRAMAGMRKRNFMPKTLAVLGDDMRVAIAERQQLRAAPAFDPERSRWSAKMNCWISGTWTDGWGPEPGKPGCQMPQQFQDEIQLKRNKVA